MIISIGLFEVTCTIHFTSLIPTISIDRHINDSPIQVCPIYFARLHIHRINLLTIRRRPIQLKQCSGLYSMEMDSFAFCPLISFWLPHRSLSTRLCAHFNIYHRVHAYVITIINHGSVNLNMSYNWIYLYFVLFLVYAQSIAHINQSSRWRMIRPRDVIAQRHSKWQLFCVFFLFR